MPWYLVVRNYQTRNCQPMLKPSVKRMDQVVRNYQVAQLPAGWSSLELTASTSAKVSQTATSPPLWVPIIREQGKIFDGAITQNKPRFLQRRNPLISTINRLNDRSILPWSKFDIFGHCGHKRRFSWLSKFYCPHPWAPAQQSFYKFVLLFCNFFCVAGKLSF